MREGRLPVEAAAAGAGAASEPGGGATSGAAGESGGGGAAGGTAGAAPALDRRLRANAALELVLFDRLPAGQRRPRARRARQPARFVGPRPRPRSGTGRKAAGPETARRRP